MKLKGITEPLKSNNRDRKPETRYVQAGVHSRQPSKQAVDGTYRHCLDYGPSAFKT